ncbi:MAG: hypothetical protein V1672_04675 [Candidatus Diapherotrites archaeon]
MASNLFPTIKFSNGELVIYGFAHGFSIEGATGLEIISRRVKNALRTASKKFSPDDYFIVEGFDPEIYAKAASETEMRDMREGTIDNMAPIVNPLLPKDAIVEFPEHYIFDLSGGTDPGGIMERKLLDIIAEATGKELSSGGEVTKLKEGDIFQGKQKEIELLVKAGFDRKAAKTFIESRTTFRSLLLSVIARNRQLALGGTTRLFCGFVHSSEIEAFLKNPKMAGKYMEKWGSVNNGLFSEIYGHVNQSNNVIDRYFTLHSKGLEPREKGNLMKFCSLDLEQNYLEHVRTNAHKPRPFVGFIDIPRFRKRPRLK